MSDDLAPMGLSLQAEWHDWLRELVSSTTVEVPTAAPLESLYPTIAPLVMLEEEMAELMRSLTTNFLSPPDPAGPIPQPTQEPGFSAATTRARATASTHPNKLDALWSIPDIAPGTPGAPAAPADAAEPNAFAESAKTLFDASEKTSKALETGLNSSDVGKTYGLQNAPGESAPKSPLSNWGAGSGSSESSNIGDLSQPAPGNGSAERSAPTPSVHPSTTSKAAQNAARVDPAKVLASPNVSQLPHALEPAAAERPDSKAPLAHANSSQQPSLFSNLPLRSDPTAENSAAASAEAGRTAASAPAIGNLQDFAKALSTAPWTLEPEVEGGKGFPQTSLGLSQPEGSEVEGVMVKAQPAGAVSPSPPTHSPAALDPDSSSVPLEDGALQQRGSNPTPPAWENAARAEPASRSGLDPPLEDSALDPDQILDVIQAAINRDYRRFYGV